MAEDKIEKYRVVLKQRNEQNKFVTLEIDCDDFDYVTEGDTFVHFTKEEIDEDDDTLTISKLVLGLPVSELLYFQKV